MEVVSTMGSGHLGCEIDLSEFREELAEDDVSVSSITSAMITFRLEENGPANSIYRTGTFQIRGTASPEDLHEAADRLVEYLKKKQVPISNPTFDHKTSVFLSDLGQQVDLETLAVTLGLERIEYEPEQFPGLVYRPDEIDATFLVFSTGKVIIGGATEKNVVRDGIEIITRNL
ncbi:transcription factor [Haloarcula sp. H-GB5]